jgi:hypothetical protein
VLLDGLDARLRVEPLDEQHGGTGVERQAQHDVEAEDVEQRQHAEGHVGGELLAALVALDLLEVREQVAVAEHGRPRRSGGAAGEHQHGQVAGLALDDRHGVDREQVLERVRPLEVDPRGGDDVRQLGQRGPIESAHRSLRRRRDDDGLRAHGAAGPRARWGRWG